MRKILLFASTMLYTSMAIALIHDDKKVSTVQASTNTNCVYFKLEGVSTADPAVNGSDWFSVKSDSPSKEEILSLAMAAFASDATVRVSTSGNAACGYAEVSYLRLVK